MREGNVSYWRLRHSHGRVTKSSLMDFCIDFLSPCNFLFRTDQRIMYREGGTSCILKVFAFPASGLSPHLTSAAGSLIG